MVKPSRSGGRPGTGTSCRVTSMAVGSMRNPSPSAAAPSAPTLSARNRRRDREGSIGGKVTSASPPIPLSTFVERGDDFSISFPLSANAERGTGGEVRGEGGRLVRERWKRCRCDRNRYARHGCNRHLGRILQVGRDDKTCLKGCDSKGQPPRAYGR